MTKDNKQETGNKNKRRREEKFMSIKETDLKKGWTEMETIAKRCSAAPPNIDSNSTDLNDLFEWGSWVVQKGKLTKSDSRRLLNELRKSKKK